jgi:hypothetical protein
MSVSSQSVADVSRRGIRRECIVYKGICFYRYPDSPHACGRNYFVPGVSHRKRGVDWLHRELWKDAHGPIPDGHEIHHRDENTLNNALENLECLSGKAHRDLHAQGLTPAQIAWRRAHAQRIRLFAANWHGSPEGRAWHSELSKRSWEGRQPVAYECDHCGSAFESRKPSRVRFCSAKCRAAQRRADGKDREARTCAVCGQSFSCCRFEETRSCSRQCANRLNRVNAPVGVLPVGALGQTRRRD